MSKFGTFVGKSYESGGLFRLSLTDVCNKVVYNIINIDETNVWYSRLCHVNFGWILRLGNLSLIPKFTVVKNSKCNVLNQNKLASPIGRGGEELGTPQINSFRFVRNE